MTNQKSAPSIAFAVFLFYLLPLISLIVFTNQFVPASDVWVLWSAGLLMAAIGSLVLFGMIRSWEIGLAEILPESLLKEDVSPPLSFEHEIPVEKASKEQNDEKEQLALYEQSLKEAQAKAAESLEQLNSKNEEVQKFAKDNERYQRQAELVLQEFAQYKKAAQEQLEQKGTLLADYQQTMAEQKAILEKKQHQIAQLESKVHDLTYEIKTLLQLAELGNQTLDMKERGAFSNELTAPFALDLDEFQDDLPSVPETQIRTFEDASVQLRRCIDIAQKMTGAGYFSSSSRFRDIHEDHYAIDLRRLYDSLRGEKGGAVLFYSQRENKLLFVNTQAKNLLGFSPEKFVQNFSDIVAQGMDEWRKALTQLIAQQEVKVSLVMKSKAGQDVLVHGVLGIIPTGLFKHHVIGVLYPA